MSNAPKMLNLDELAQEERVVVLKGNRHVMKEITVDDFIELSKKGEEIKENMPVSDQVSKLIGMVVERFPTMNEKELKSLPLNQLWAIMKFAREDEKVEEVAREVEAAKQEKSGKK